MKLVIDLKESYFQHQILIVDDFKTSDSWQQLSPTDQLSYLQNIQVYVGEDPDNHLNNNLCPGGPYLDLNDPANWVDEPCIYNSQWPT